MTTQLNFLNFDFNYFLGGVSRNVNRNNQIQGYEDIMHEEDGEFDYDIRDTLRKTVKLDYFSNLCSEILPVKTPNFPPR